jgi:hypothetical protein
MYRFIPYSMAAMLALAPASPARADAGFIHASPSLTLAKPCDPGASCLFSWTLASRLGHILRFVEDRFGPRDKSWTILGVEFTSRDAPQVWYPTYDGVGGAIIVQLTRAAATDETRALFQLSHEAVHLLSPAGPGAGASVLEEGLATWISLQYLRAIDRAVGPNYISAPRYERAYRLVERLSQRPDFLAGVRMLRQVPAGLSAVTAADLLRAWPGLPFADAQVLAERF